MRTLAATIPAMSVGPVSHAQPAAPIVYVLSTGGTIAGAGSSSTDLSNYKPGSILGEQLVKAVPQIAQIADVRVEQIANVNSSDITIENWLTLAKRIQDILTERPAVAGFVSLEQTHSRKPLTSSISPSDQTSPSCWSARCARQRRSAPTAR
jgi:L-asparaginase/Glu-tRNA(Gln) amidotransferase subunit D